MTYTEQFAEFNKILGEIAELHQRKAHDYGSAPIAHHGYIGILVRMWDKMHRLENLTNAVPEHEAIDDTLMDLASYAIIALVYRRGKWGK